MRRQLMTLPASFIPWSASTPIANVGSGALPVDLDPGKTFVDEVGRVDQTDAVCKQFRQGALLKGDTVVQVEQFEAG